MRSWWCYHWLGVVLPIPRRAQFRVGMVTTHLASDLAMCSVDCHFVRKPEMQRNTPTACCTVSSSGLKDLSWVMSKTKSIICASRSPVNVSLAILASEESGKGVSSSRLETYTIRSGVMDMTWYGCRGLPVLVVVEGRLNGVATVAVTCISTRWWQDSSGPTSRHGYWQPTTPFDKCPHTHASSNTFMKRHTRTGKQGERTVYALEPSPSQLITHIKGFLHPDSEQPDVLWECDDLTTIHKQFRASRVFIWSMRRDDLLFWDFSDRGLSRELWITEERLLLRRVWGLRHFCQPSSAILLSWLRWLEHTECECKPKHHWFNRVYWALGMQEEIIKSSWSFWSTLPSASSLHTWPSPGPDLLACPWNCVFLLRPRPYPRVHNCAFYPT